MRGITGTRMRGINFLFLGWQVLHNATVNLLRHVSRLQCLTDNLALLDMLCAFAAVACSTGGQYVRPKMTDAGPIAIVDGRHVLLENLEDSECQVMLCQPQLQTGTRCRQVFCSNSFCADLQNFKQTSLPMDQVRECFCFHGITA